MRTALVSAFLLASVVAAGPAMAEPARTTPAPTDTAAVVTVDFSAKGHPFPHFWEHTFGSGRAILSLRDSYRIDLREVKKITDFQSIRFHGIFDDDVGVYQEQDGKPVYNWSYVDQIYDGLLQNHVKPYVELSFMPAELSVTPPTVFSFWYKPTVSPPKDWTKWDAMIEAFARHLVARYGLDEVASWDFEVWNEPNIDFWAGKPKEATYYELYDHTAQALKRVSPRLQVGGPSTAQAAWVDRFIAHCAKGAIPVDFISTHVYANDTAEDVFGTHEKIPRRDMVVRAVQKVHDQVKASSMPGLPVIFSEFNASYFNEVDVTDSPFMGPWLAQVVARCDGLVDTMAYWCFSDVFEEGGVVKRPFYGGFGLMAEDDIPKPAFNAFLLLHKLGTVRIPADSDSVLATRTPDGRGVVAVWNYAEPEELGTPQTIHLKFTGRHFKKVRRWRLDAGHGNALAAWRSMGSPDFPTQAQIGALREAGRLSEPETVPARETMDIPLTPHALELIELLP